VDTSLISVLANLGTSGVVIVLIILGYLIPKPAHARVVEDGARKDEVIAKLQEALALERQRADDAAQAGGVTNRLISGLVQLATEHRAAEKHEHSDAADKASEHYAAVNPLDLTGEDLGLL
jgi:hypothetical protein